MVDEQKARERLTQLLADLDDEQRALRDETTGGDPGELSHLDQHPAEAASLLSDNDREAALREVVEAQRAEVEQALQRLDSGTYGVCVDCGKAIPEARLDAKPEAARCVADQERFEAATR